jgi:hypothetical protein
MSTGKSLAQVRGDILADIEAIRMGRLPAATGAVIFAGYKEITATINTEIALFKTALQAKDSGMEFAKVARLGKRVVNEEDEHPLER